ncbi:MAG: hypothetical protein KJ630_15420 [Proteobacteria bacterium]|nr:hypothetical protein [Pseudomonadota bacterium]
MTTDFSNNGALKFIKKFRGKGILFCAVLVFILFIAGGLALQKKSRSGKELQSESVPKTVELRLQAKKENAEQADVATQSASFSLRPSPDELLQQLTSLENYNEDVLAAKYRGLRVLWPAYFFSLQLTEESKGTLVVDVAEDGFGVMIESEVDISAFPQLRDLEAGNKLWIGGEILVVDRTGTGTIYLKTEHLKLGDEPIPQTKRMPGN